MKRLTLALWLCAPLAASCGGEATMQHLAERVATFSTSAALVPNLSPFQSLTQVLTVYQLSAAQEAARDVPTEQKYPFDVFQHMRDTNLFESSAPAALTVVFIDRNGDQRRDLYAQRSSILRAARVEFILTSNEWGRHDANGTLVPPPPFRAKIELFDGATRIAATPLTEIPAGTLFAQNVDMVLPALESTP